MTQAIVRKPTPDSFCELATKESLRRLRNNLPELQLQSPFSTKYMENLDNARLLQSYFDCYGFGALTGLDTDLNYYFGALEQDGLSLVSHVWQLPSSSEYVLVVHGLFDHVGLYLKLVQYLLEAGFSVVAVDMPGHGLSSGEVGVINDFADYAQAIQGVMTTISEGLVVGVEENENSKIRWYGVGQSTGAAALMRFLFSEGECSRDSVFQKAVFLAPLVKPKSWWSVYLSFFIFSKFVSSVKRKFSINSHDKHFIAFLRERDPLQPKHISIKWVGAMIQWVKGFSLFPSCSVPILVIQGTGDHTVNYLKNIPLIQRQFSNNEVFQLDDAMHHLVNETDEYRLPVFEKMVDFLK